MKRDMLQQAANYTKAHQRKKRWYQVVIGLASIVVFCTVYALILPAITMESEFYCGKTEHQHDEACYQPKLNLVCGQEESDGHAHALESCYTLTCQLAVSQGHIHTEECKGITCGLEENEEHQHDDSCYGDICGQEESEGHTHTIENCYELTCTEVESEGHRHHEECYEKVLICEKNEDGAHTHTNDCYEAVLTCSQEEHIHTLACSSNPEADIEVAAGWEKTLPQKLTGAWADDLLTVAGSQLGYTESKANYQVAEDGETIKGYTRYGAWYGDSYGDWCAMFVSFCLNYAEIPTDAMPWEANCQRWIDVLQSEEYNLYQQAHPQEGEELYTPVPGDLIFFDWEADGKVDHVGLVAELIPETEEAPAQVRTIEGNSSNKVQYVTYALTDPVISGYGRLPEQIFYCGKTGHVHTDACTDRQGQLICEQEEHVHTDICEEAPAERIELTYTGPDYTVRVQYGADAALPEGVTLLATEIPSDSEAYQSCYDQAVAAMETNETAQAVVFARFFDVQFQVDGQKVEPAAPVSVTITYASEVETGEQTNCQAIHITEDGTEVLDVTTEKQVDGSTSFTHTQDGFSVVGDVVTVSAAYNSADNGPDKLTVDYYVCIDGEWVCVGSTKTGWYGDYSASDWTDTNRDYITVAQAASVLGPYGFDANGSLSKKTAYQQKSGNSAVYADTNVVEKDGTYIVPLSRNEAHLGYNLYYLPNNSDSLSSVSSPDSLNKAANSFYTVKVFDAQGTVLHTEFVITGGSFAYDASASGVAEWLISYGSGSTGTISGSTISLTNITSPVTVSPQREGTAGSCSVTFKVMIDGQWQTVGSLPYYYSGTVNGQQRAYITSAMAVQFFGDYGYTATTAPGYHFGYSYNDIYNILYASNTGFAMDINGANIAENEKVQLWEFNDSDAQIFRIWEAEEGYSYITPLANSSLHVNVLGGGSANDAPIGLHSATDNSSRWRLQWESDGRVSFWTKNAPDSACIDLDNGTTANGTKIHIWNGTENRYWKLSQLYRISNNIVSEQNSDGTYKIGLTAQSNGDIVCYYLPAETVNSISGAAESDISTQNSFWSVSVQDSNHLVYSDGELSGLVRYAQNGGEAAITVRNAEGILWSCVGAEAENVTSSQSGGNTTFVIKNVTQPVEVVATKVNPSFTVQYYANIDRYVLGSSGDLDVIDTSGANLPTNSATQPLLWLTLENTGANTNQNAGNQTSLYRVKSEKRLTQMYTDGIYSFEQHPGLEYIDKLWEQSNYKLDAVLVLKDGRSPDSTNDDDWWWYQINQTTWSNITFTNLASEENAPRQEGVKQGRDGNYCILLQEDTVLRLRYETNNQNYTNQTSFHDYDITSGVNADGTWRSGVTGINSASNYVTSRNGQRKWTWNGVGSSTADVFAFGNQNCETGLGLAQWGGNNINAYNGASPVMENGNREHYGNDVYQGCTFGLVKGLDSSGNLIWDEWITAPYLFDDGTATGKHSYNGGSLQFKQTGDTYTLTTANSTVGTRDNLDYFFNPSPSSSTTHTHIFTNNFWPMDSATDKTDPLMGAKNPNLNQCDIQVNGFWDAQNQVGGSHNNVNVPISDDGRAHNWFFGMNFAITFNLTEDYEGPLEYIFFGDDDMWVFLDGQLICDIGGVHSSVGEYVNLWDYLEKGDAKRHTLSFFYTERGASGSTCWMSFTLPSVTSAATGINTGSLQIEKKLEGTGDTDYSGEEYEFKVELMTDENGSALNQTFSYSRSDGTYGILKSGGAIALHQDEIITISGIPAGTFYRVTELSTAGYHTTVNGNEGYIVSGKIETGAVKPAEFINTPYCELPSTGGPGTLLYTFSGIALMALALVYDIHRRRKGEM